MMKTINGGMCVDCGLIANFDHRCAGTPRRGPIDVDSPEPQLVAIIKEMQLSEAKTGRALLYAEEQRLQAETDMLKFRAECYDMRQELAQLKHVSPRRIGGTFGKRKRFPEADHELVGEVLPQGNYDEYRWKWSRSAVEAGLGRGLYTSLPSEVFEAMPYVIRADSWWHLCAKVGTTEGIARLCYFHPEEGQESAVAKARPVSKPVVPCEWDFIE